MRSDRRSPPVAAGEISPVAWNRQTQRIALAMLTPKRLAAALRDMPPLLQRPQHVCEDRPKAPSPAASFARRASRITNRQDSGIPPDSVRWITALVRFGSY